MSPTQLTTQITSPDVAPDGRESLPESGLAVGYVLAGRYRLERLLGTGGMAQVWEASDSVLDRRVAVKVLHRHLSSPASLQRFRQEAIAAAKFNHPNVVAIYDTVSTPDAEAIVMELVDGITLRRHLDDNRPISIPDTLHVGVSVADALAAAHRTQLVHRDVKPANILLCRDGRVKITDFGIAKAAEGEGLTKEGTLVGTAAYLAPEQLGSATVDGRADLFALGLVLYECCVGVAPYTGDTDAAVALARLHHVPAAPARVNKSVPADVSSAVMRALEREPTDRFQTADELRDALVAVQRRIARERALSANATPQRPAIDPGRSPAPSRRLPHSSSESAAKPVEAVSDTDDSDEFLAEDTDQQTDTFEIPNRLEGPRPTERRRWVAPAVIASVVGLAVLLAIGLLGGAPDQVTSPTTAVAPSDAQTPVALSAPKAVDPDGTGGENDGAVERSLDNDATTAWSTEFYGSRTFEGLNKSGVGIAWSTNTGESVDRLEIDTHATGWSAQVYVLPTLDGFDSATLTSETPVGTVTSAKSGTVSMSFSRPASGIILLWITDLGTWTDGASKHRDKVAVDVIEARAFAKGSDASG